MNTPRTPRISFVRLWAAVLLVLGLTAVHTLAAEKGAERLQSMTKVATMGDLDNLKAGDKFVMVCGKCQTVMMHTVNKDKGREIATMTAKHLCAGCNSTITTVGHGKSKTDKVAHTCSGCGDGSVFCCASSKGGKGAKATSGMQTH